MRKTIDSICRPNIGAFNFFCSILLWGIGVGCFAAVLNNYLVEVRNVSEMERGILEFFREMPGLLLVFILAVMHKFTDWKILKVGTIISMLGLVGLMLSSDKVLLIAMIMIWSAGEHIVMPVRSSLAMHLAREGKLGRALGLVTSAMNAGSVTGSVIVALVFLIGTKYFHIQNKVALYTTVWSLILVLLGLSLFSVFTAKTEKGVNVRRPRLYFHRKYMKFYALELFYGARKQVFMTFAPYVLILVYGMDTATMAILAGICALVNIFCAPLIGKLTDAIGYKNIMIYDTVVLFFVCVIYGYADKFFPKEIAYWVVCVNYLLDAVISTSSMATNVYVRTISANEDELTSTITTGISINHLISIIAALLGGIVWKHFGIGVLFTFSAIMALANSAFALTIPSPQGVTAASRRRDALSRG